MNQKRKPADLYVISGVTGMTGSELARQLVRSQHRVVGFDNFFASSIASVQDIAAHPLFTFHEYDLNNHKQMARLAGEICGLKGGNVRVIYINCAAVVHTEHFYHVNRTFATNVQGMKSFLDQAVAVGAEIYINCSTSEVYSMASWRDGGVRESDYLQLACAEHSQRTSYAAGKLMTEFFMKDAVDAGSIKGCSVRFANVYSQSELYPKHIIPHILHSLKETGRVELLENSRKNKRTFLHNADSCSAVRALIGSDSALDGTVYNVATDEEISIIDLVSLCGKHLEIMQPEIMFRGWRTSDPERRLLNTEKIRTRTGWTPKVTLEQGIALCVEKLL